MTAPPFTRRSAVPSLAPAPAGPAEKRLHDGPGLDGQAQLAAAQALEAGGAG